MGPPISRGTVFFSFAHTSKIYSAFQFTFCKHTTGFYADRERERERDVIASNELLNDTIT